MFRHRNSLDDVITLAASRDDTSAADQPLDSVSQSAGVDETTRGRFYVSGAALASSSLAASDGRTTRAAGFAGYIGVWIGAYTGSEPGLFEGPAASCVTSAKVDNHLDQKVGAPLASLDWGAAAAPSIPGAGEPSADASAIQPAHQRGINQSALATTQPQKLDFTSGAQGVFGSNTTLTFSLPSFLYQHYAFGIGAGFDGFGIYAGASVTGGVKGSVALSLGQFTPDYPVTIDPGVAPFVHDGDVFSIDPSLVSTNDAKFSLSLPQAHASLDFGLQVSAGVSVYFPSIQIGVSLPFVGFVGYTVHIPSQTLGFNAGKIYSLPSNTSISIPGDGTVTLSELQAKTVNSTPQSAYGALPTLSLSGNTDPFFVANTDLASLLAEEVPDPFAALQGSESFYGIAGVSYKLLSLPLSGSLWLNEQVTLTPIAITETVTAGGVTQTGTLGDSFNFTAPTSGSGVMPVSITFGLELAVHTTLELDGNIKLTLEGPEASASILGVSGGVGPLGNFNLLNISGELFPLYSNTFTDTLTTTTTVDVQTSATTVSKMVTGPSKGVSLTKPGTNLTVTAAGTVTGAAFGVQTGTLSAALVNNFGLITATGNGVDLQEGGTVDVESGGRITAAGASPGDGILVTGNAIAAVDNQGAITGFSVGVDLNGGSVKNETRAQISASTIGVAIANTNASIVNDGSISAATGVSLVDGGKLYNTQNGVIAGTNYGVYASAAVSVENSGALSGGGFAVRAIAGGSVTNLDGAYIHGGSIGVLLTGGAGETLTNGVGATISGATYGVYLSGANVTLVDYGGISGGKDAVVLNGTSSNTLVLSPDAQLTGGVTFSSALNNSVTLAAATGEIGTLTGLGGAIPLQGGEIYIAPGAAWDVVGNFTNVWVTDLNKADHLDDTAIAYSVGERAQVTVVNEGGGFYIAEIAIHKAGMPTTTVGDIQIAESVEGFGYTPNVPSYGLTITAGAAGGVDVGFVQNKFTTVTADQGEVTIGPNGLFAPTVTIAAGVTISPNYYGLDTQHAGVNASQERATVTNFGSIEGGVTLQSGGLLDNGAGGMIAGAIRLTSYALSKSYAADQSNTVSIINEGIVTGGVSGSTGLVMNLAGGQISGGLNAVSLEAGSVWNQGTIAAGAVGARSSVRLYTGGFVYNETGGLLSSQAKYFFGVDISGGYGTVINRGDIASSAFGAQFSAGVFLANGGRVVNQDGTISGATAGVRIAGGAGNVANSGSITGVILANGGTIVNATNGIISAAGGYGVNVSSPSGSAAAYLHNMGRIDGVLASGANLIVNDGTIDGAGVVAGSAGHVTVTNSGLIENSGGISVKFSSPSDRLIAEAGSQFVGSVAGGGGVLELAGMGAETITGLGGVGQLTGAVSANLSGFGDYVVDAGISLTISGSSTLAQGTTLIDYGQISMSGGAVLHAYGLVEIGGSLNFVGSIKGAPGSDGLGSNGAIGLELLPAGAVTFNGFIGGGAGQYGGAGHYQGGDGGDGLMGASSGAITSNNGLIAGGAGGGGVYGFGAYGGGAGGAGVDLGSGVIENGAGTIIGGAGGGGAKYSDIGGGGGAGGVGIELAHGGTVVNTGGMISGGAGGAGGSAGYFGGNGGAGGAAVVFSGDGTVTNLTGTIAGGAGGGGGSGGYGSGYSGQAGDGVFLGDGGTVINGGPGVSGAVITGGIGVHLGGGGAATVINFGTIQGVNGAAVQFDTAGGRLIAEAGSTWLGAVNGGGGTLELAGGSGTISGLGGGGGLSGAETMAFGGFDSYVIDAGGSWVLVGGHTLAANQTLTNDGTLKGLLALGAASDRLILGGGSVNNGAIAGGGGTLELTGPGGTITGLGAAGTLSGAAVATFSGFGAYVIDAGGSWVLTGGQALAAHQSLTNAGTLQGSLTLSGATDRLILNKGSIINGAVAGGGGTLELLGGSSTITGLGAVGTLSGGSAATFSGFGAYAIDAGASLTLNGANKLGAGQTLNVGGSLINNGSIIASAGAGINLTAGGTVNIAQSSDLISGTIGAYAGAGGAATIINYGTLKGLGGTAVQFASANDRLIVEAGCHFNGSVIGGGGALELGAATGTITGLGSAGKLTGAQFMSFSGFGAYSIDAGGNWTLTGKSALGASQTLDLAGTLTNNGTLNVAGVAGFDIQAGGLLTNNGTVSGTAGAGVVLSPGGLLVNAAGQLISGINGVLAGAGGGASVTNFGTIRGSGGAAVSFASTSDRLIVESGSAFVGAVKGGGGLLELASGGGTISGLGGLGTLSGAEAMTFSGFGSYDIDAGASWTLAGADSLAANQTLTNAGTLKGSLAFTAASDRLIVDAGSADVGGVAGGGAALELTGQGGTLSGLGAVGTLSGATTMTFSGFGSYTIDAGANWTAIGTNELGTGESLAVAGSLTNIGTITVASSAGVNLAAGGRLINATAGSVISGATGAYAGVGVIATVINYGLITGTGGVAVKFASAGDRLILEAGASLSGVVQGGGGTLELAGTAGAISGLGGAFSGFGAYRVDGGGDWTINGSNFLLAGRYIALAGSLTNAGTIQSGAGAAGAYGQTGGSGGTAVKLVTGAASLDNIGTIAGGQGGAGGNAVYAGAGGLGGAGVILAAADSSAVNSGAIAGGDGGQGGYTPDLGGGAGGAGGVGFLMAQAATLTNSGSITGGAGGLAPASPAYGGAGGAGGAGVSMTSAGLLTNLGGTITGGAGGNAGYGGLYGGAGGTGGSGVIATAGGTIINLSGAILGAAGGSPGTSPGNWHGPAGAAGDGVALSSGGIVINGSSTSSSARIQGLIGVYAGLGGAATLTNYGQIDGTSGVAVQFKSSADRLIAETGSTWVGSVLGGGGTLELASGAGTITGLGAAGYVSGAEAMKFSGFGSYAIDGGTTWTLTGTNALASSQSLNNAGSLVIANKASLTLEGALINSGQISLAAVKSAATLVIGAPGLTLSGHGSVVLGNKSLNTVVGTIKTATLVNVDNTISGAGRLGDAKLVLINGAAGLIVQAGTQALVINTGTAAVTNAGTIEATGAGGLTISGGLVNTGLLEVTKGGFVVSGAVTGTGSAIISGGTLSFASNFSQNVTFSGAGELALAKSQTFTATISGFSKTGLTSLDLGDIGFVSASEATFSGTTAGGVLTVTDGTHTARITFVGNYKTSIWTVSSDGAGGVIVVDPTPTAQAPPSPRSFAGAIAGMASTGSQSSLAANVPPQVVPVLARPGA